MVCLLVGETVELPITKHRDQIVRTVRENQITIVVGETGSGKTTQVPVMLLEAGFARSGIIGITEPRRIAAIATAQFVSQQVGTKLGDRVGYQVRFDDTTMASTSVKFMTDGILLREFQIDPELSKYSVVMVDEAHERSQNIDFVLGLLKDLLERRKDLKVVVASATIDEKKFSAYFSNAPIVSVSGQMFPVEVIWSDREIYHSDNPVYSDMIGCVVERIEEIHATQGQGDVLVFMAGEADIAAVIKGLEKKALAQLTAVPVYGSLPPDEQRKIFDTYPGVRKVVVATNIAETSVTIDGVVYVVDSGYVKQMNFHPLSGIQSLDLVKHSKAGCEQRKGRAGRTRPGLCYRMYTQADFERRKQFTEPEIRRVSLASVVLAMEDIGIEDVEGFDFLDRPEAKAFHEAYETLIALGAIKRGGRGLTGIGKAMARLPLEPRIARMLLEAQQYGCASDVATVAAFLSVKNIFFRPKEGDKQAEAEAAHEQFKQSGSDILAFLEAWDRYSPLKNGEKAAWCFTNFLNAKALREAENIRAQLIGVLKQSGIELSQAANRDTVQKAVAVGLAYNLFEHESRYGFRAVQRELSDVFVHPSSAMFGGVTRFFVATEVVQTSKTYARNCMTVEPEWLPAIVPHLARLGPPTVASYCSGADTALVNRPVLYRGRYGEETVGQAESQVAVSEAVEIQNSLIRDAESRGWVRLVFTTDGISDPSDYRLVARHNGRVYRGSLFAGIEEGVPYYCAVELFINRCMATPQFRVWDFPVYAVKALKPEADLKALAEHWGGRLK